ncbi:contact-dependent growth inhibition system immunity protein [Lysobacter sp. HA18]
MSDFLERQGKQASVALWRTRLLVMPLSGRGLVKEDRTLLKVLPEDAADAEIADAILSTLEASRVLSIHEAQGFLRYDKSDESKRRLVLQQAVGAPESRRLFAGMLKCNVKQYLGKVSISPTRRLRGDSWEALGQESIVEIPVTAMPQEVVAGLRRAFAMCVG